MTNQLPYERTLQPKDKNYSELKEWSADEGYPIVKNEKKLHLLWQIVVTSCYTGAYILCDVVLCKSWNKEARGHPNHLNGLQERNHKHR